MLLIELARRDAFQADPARLSGLLSIFMATYAGLKPALPGRQPRVISIYQ
jgi:hypothetical protein